MTKIILTIIFTLSTVSLASAQIKSVYTSVDEKHCKTLKPQDTNVIYRGRCAGVAGYKLEVNASEEHQWIELVAPAGKRSDVGLQPVAYDSVGKTAEWRVRNGKPIAVIVRFDLRQEFGGKVTDSLLVVSKITGSKACVTDVVKGGKDQNARAHRLADQIRPCNPSPK
jgi:hypothetical protein